MVSGGRCIMRRFRVVAFPPLFDQDLGVAEAVEDLAIQDLVAEAGVEAFTISVLPWAAWFDASGLCPDSLDPIPDGLGHEFRAVVGSYERRHAAQDEHVTQDVDDAASVKLPVDADRQAFPAIFIDNVERAERLAVIRAAVRKVIAPHMIATFRPHPDARGVIQPKPSLPRLVHRHFQPLSSPQSFDALVSHMPACIAAILR